MGRDSLRIMRSLLSPFWLVVLAALAVLLLLATPISRAVGATAAPAAPPPPTVGLDDVAAGALLLRTATPGRFVPAPLVMTDAHIRVSGLVARVELRQRFLNPTRRWLDGLYVFPLPENAAVDRMRLEAGGAVIEARIREREAARRAWAEARRQGRRAALVEQHRPNLFTNSVATIAPGETVTVTLRYQQTMRYDQGRFRLRFPMVVAPRYMPAVATVALTDRGGWATATRPAPEPPPPAAPVLRPEAGKINPVAIRVSLDAGMPLADLSSSYHRITAEGWEDGTAEITLADGPVPADRDFELVWTPQTGSAPVAGLFRETVGGETYLLAMVLPPAGDHAPVPPRDVVFVLDRSGSMGGTSIRQARAAFAAALARLRPVDRFEVIRFNGRTEQLFGAVRRADRAAVARAVAWVNGTEADGGTEMMAALRAALAESAPTGRLRQVVFLTDGAVGNERALLVEIERRLGAARLFTVGIGSAPNSYFMTAAARSGRGSFTYIGALDEVAARIDGLFAKLERPAMIDLAAAWTAGAGGGQADAYPKRVPDLYHGEPLVIVAKLPAAASADPAAALHLSGTLGDRRWRHTLGLAGAREAPGIAALWGRARIETLMAGLHRGADAARVREAVTGIALRFGLVSRYTSLIAVQEKAVRPADAPTASAVAPLNLPAGWDYDKVFGDVPMQRSPLQKTSVQGAPVQNASVRGAAGATAMTPVRLPQGATGWELRLAAGLALLLAALGWGWGWGRGRRRCG